MTRVEGLVIGWMPHSQRCSTLAGRLGYEVSLLGRIGFRRWWTAAIVYPFLALRSVWLILRLRPRAVVVVAPPFVAPLALAPVARLVGARFAVDIHTGALLDRRWRWSVGMLAFVCRHSAAAVVTLPSLARRLHRLGVDAVVIPDPLPIFPDHVAPPPARSRPLVVSICGWGSDEPIMELLEAARNQAWDLAITGRPRTTPGLPPNVRLTGFLDDSTYGQLLASANLIVVLTRRDETLLSGAWEALALRRPVIVSATPALVETFGPRVAAAGPDARSIAAAIARVLADPDASQRSQALALRFMADNDKALVRLSGALQGPWT